jgi:hypothetical protein
MHILIQKKDLLEKFFWRGQLKKKYTPESQVKALVWLSEFKWRLRG